MRLRPRAATCTATIAVAGGPDCRDRIAGGSGPTAFAVVCSPAVADGPRAAYSRPVDSYSRPVGSPVGFTGKSWDWCRRMVARHRVLAVLTATAAVIAALGLAGVLLISLGGSVELSNFAALSWVVAAAAVGQAVRARRAQQAMLVDRARRAEEGREDEARRRVQAERLRIARELHDAVGHQVALISVQAGAMTYLLDKDPVGAKQSLAHIQNASEAALEELRLAVGLLRQPGDGEVGRRQSDRRMARRGGQHPEAEQRDGTREHRQNAVPGHDAAAPIPRLAGEADRGAHGATVRVHGATVNSARAGRQRPASKPLRTQ